MDSNFEKGASRVWYPMLTEEHSIEEVVSEAEEVIEDEEQTDRPKGPILNWV